jgi:hypothetical protein
VRIVFRDSRQGKSTQLWKLNDGFVEQSFTPGGSANNRSEKGMNSSIEAGVKNDDVRGHVGRYGRRIRATRRHVMA